MLQRVSALFFFSFFLTVQLVLVAHAGASGARRTALAEIRKPPKNLNAFSLRYWPRNSLRKGETVTANTPYGPLTCTSQGFGRRDCSLRYLRGAVAAVARAKGLGSMGHYASFIGTFAIDAFAGRTIVLRPQ